MEAELRLRNEANTILPRKESCLRRQTIAFDASTRKVERAWRIVSETSGPPYFSYDDESNYTSSNLRDCVVMANWKSQPDQCAHTNALLAVTVLTSQA
jgi:hypothetical protein